MSNELKNDPNLPFGFETLNFEELVQNFISPGEVKLIRKNGKHLKILGPGDIVDVSELEKFNKPAHQLIIKRETNEQLIKDFTKILNALKNAKMENERARIRKEVLWVIKNDFWQEGAIGGALDLVYVSEKIFMKFDRPMIKELQYKNAEFLKRSYVLAGIVVNFAIILGYVEFDFLQDLYHLCFIYDFSLGQKDITYNILKALEKEQVLALSGINDLRSTEGKRKELVALFKWPIEAPKLAKDRCGKFFNNKDVLDLLLRIHERVSGNGLPFALLGHEMLDIENLLILLNLTIPLSFNQYSKGGVPELIHKILSFKDTDDKYSRVQKTILIEIRKFNKVSDEEASLPREGSNG